MRLPSRAALALAVTCGLFAFAASASAGDIHALTDDGRLVTFDDATPGVLDGDVAVTGLSLDEELIALDVHPCDGRLFALSNQDRVYTIDPATGAATVSSALSSSLGTSAVGGTFEPGSEPDSQLWRVVDESDGNRTINVASGAVTADTDLQYDAGGSDNGRDPSLSAIALIDGMLVGIDTDIDELVSISPAADGTLTRVGRLGVDAAAPVGLDYRAGDERLFASINVGGVSGLYAVNPATGHIAFLGTIGDGSPVVDVAAALVPFSELQMGKLDLKFNFKKSGKDMVHIRGKLPTPEGEYTGMMATVDVGGVLRTFTLEKNGKGTNNGDTFHFEGKPKDGLVQYDVKFKKGDFADDFADEGMDGSEAAKKDERRIVVVIEVDGETYASEATVSYTAKVGKEGNAKLIETAPVSTLPDAGCPQPPPPPASFLVNIKGNKNTVTLEIGEAGESPIEVKDNNSTVTVVVPADTPIELTISGNKNDVAIPAELSEATTVNNKGNNNSVENGE